MGSYKKKLLMAVDGSEQSFEAVRYVCQVFPPKRVEPVLFHVINKIPESFWDIEKNPTFRHKLAPVAAWATQQERVIEEFMERSRQLFVERGVPEGKISVRIQERKAGVARDIIREAQNGYDSVVVGRWGMNKLKDLVWGSIANKLVAHLVHVPLWVVGGSPPAGKLLVAVDSSEETMGTVDYVVTMLEGSDWQVTLFHALRGFESLAAAYEGPVTPLLEAIDFSELKNEFQQAEKTIEKVFEEANAKFAKAGLDSDRVTTKIVTGATSRAKAIVEEAQAGGYGTIVLGRRGLSRVEEFFMGRVSSKVIQLAKEMAVWVVS